MLTRGWPVELALGLSSRQIHSGLQLGDVDGDQRPDRGGSSPFALPATDSGLAWITTSSDPARVRELASGKKHDSFGWSLADAGDVNGDGYDDIIVGAPGDDTYHPDAGAAYTFSGAKAAARGADRTDPALSAPAN